MLTGEVVSAFEGIRAALDTLDAVDLDGLPAADVLDIAQLCETMARKNTVLRNDLALTLSRCPVEDVGGPAHRVLADFLRITPGEARHRIDTTEPLSARTVVSQTLAPLQPATAVAWRRGDLDDAHVRVIQRFLNKLPTAVPDTEKGQRRSISRRISKSTAPRPTGQGGRSALVDPEPRRQLLR